MSESHSLGPAACGSKTDVSTLHIHPFCIFLSSGSFTLAFTYHGSIGANMKPKSLFISFLTGGLAKWTKRLLPFFRFPTKWTVWNDRYNDPKVRSLKSLALCLGLGWTLWAVYDLAFSFWDFTMRGCSRGGEGVCVHIQVKNSPGLHFKANGQIRHFKSQGEKRTWFFHQKPPLILFLSLTTGREGRWSFEIWIKDV